MSDRGFYDTNPYAPTDPGLENFTPGGPPAVKARMKGMQESWTKGESPVLSFAESLPGPSPWGADPKSPVAAVVTVPTAAIPSLKFVPKRGLFEIAIFGMAVGSLLMGYHAIKKSNQLDRKLEHLLGRSW
jgi:hypothetical protein